MLKTNERLVYVRPDGVKYLLHAPPSRAVLSEEGFGTPPLEYVTDRAPFQDGDTVRDFHLNPRPVQLVVMQNFCSRADYWNGRNDFLDAIRPNRITDYSNPGKLLYYLTSPTLKKRQLDVFLDSGPGFAPAQPGWRELSFTEAVRFTAHDPAWYDPLQRSVTFAAAGSSDDELVFPITFPIEFSTFGGTVDVTYEGTWLEYPTIEIVGPITAPLITNQTTGDLLSLDLTLIAGESGTIVLRGQKTVTKNDGTNLLSTLSPDSDLTTFAIVPDPQAPDGVNEISASGSGLTGASSITIEYYHRYFGI